MKDRYAQRAMRFFSFHLMPYSDLPSDYDGPAWVTCPNAFYDPQLGRFLSEDPVGIERELEALAEAEMRGS